MPVARVHAVIVARPDARGRALSHFQDTVAAVSAQTRPIDALTIVLCGVDPRFAKIADASGAEGVIQTDAATGFADAIALASARVEPESDLWMLAQDTVPDLDALAQLSGLLETSPSVVVVAPKLVRRDDQSVLASLGVSMTRGGETVELARGQLDQGQHDGREDVLGVDIRGAVLRAERRSDLLPDVALGGADEGLDLGVRARLGGARVAIAPSARVAVSGDGVAGLPEPDSAADRRRIAYVTRLAQLHRRLAYAPAVLVPLHILSFIPILFWRAFVALVQKQPGRVLPEAGATIVAGTRWPSITRSRARLAGGRKEWWRVDPLRVTRAQRRSLSMEDGEPQSAVRPELHFFGGGAWLVLASLIVSIAVFPALLGWSTLGGGALLPLRNDLGQLWQDAAYGFRGYGVDHALPADPFSAVMAALGSLWPGAPSHVLVVLWLLAMPLATLGGWFAMTRLTERAGLRIAGAIMWTAAPMFLSALIDPRPAAVIVHLVLPWLLFTALVAHRSWGSAGAASLLYIVVSACSPVLGVVLSVIAVIAVLVALTGRRFVAALRVLWVPIPALALFIPVAWRQLADANPWGLLADPGLAWVGSRAADDFWGHLSVLAGFPGAGYGGWVAFLQGIGLDPASAAALASWAPLALVATVPIVLLALVGAFTRRWRVGAPLLLAGAVLAVAGLASTGIAISVVGGVAVPLWPGALLSAAWLALLGAAAVGLDAMRVPRGLRGTAVTIAVVLVLASAVPQLTAMVRGVDSVQNGPSSTLPAYVAAELASGSHGATLVLSVTSDGAIAQRVVWGASDTLSAQSTIQATRPHLSDTEKALAGQISNLVTPGAPGTIDLASSGIRFVLVQPVTRTGGPAAAMRAQAVSSINERAGLVAIGETGKGALWSVDGSSAGREQLRPAEAALSRTIAIGAIAVVLIALLIALPTPRSIRLARSRPRVVGERRTRP